MTPTEKQLKLYETIIEGVCEALGLTPSSCLIVELDEHVRRLRLERDELKETLQKQGRS